MFLIITKRTLVFVFQLAFRSNWILILCSSWNFALSPNLIIGILIHTTPSKIVWSSVTSSRYFTYDIQPVCEFCIIHVMKSNEKRTKSTPSEQLRNIFGKSQRQIDTANTCIYDISSTWLRSGISIKGGGVKTSVRYPCWISLDLFVQMLPFNETMRILSYKYNSRYLI